MRFMPAASSNGIQAKAVRATNYEDNDEKDSVIVVCCQFLFCDGEFFVLCFADFRISKI
jgi:hypothetical protein